MHESTVASMHTNIIITSVYYIRRTSRTMVNKKRVGTL